MIVPTATVRLNAHEGLVTRSRHGATIPGSDEWKYARRLDFLQGLKTRSVLPFIIDEQFWKLLF